MLRFSLPRLGTEPRALQTALHCRQCSRCSPGWDPAPQRGPPGCSAAPRWSLPGTETRPPSRTASRCPRRARLRPLNAAPPYPNHAQVRSAVEDPYAYPKGSSPSRPCSAGQSCSISSPPCTGTACSRISNSPPRQLGCRAGRGKGPLRSVCRHPFTRPRHHQCQRARPPRERSRAGSQASQGRTSR